MRNNNADFWQGAAHSYRQSALWWKIVGNSPDPLMRAAAEGQPEFWEAKAQACEALSGFYSKPWLLRMFLTRPAGPF